MTPKATPANQAARIEALCRYIESHSDEPLPLKKLANHCGLSPFHLQRRFKAVVGVSPREYHEACRLKSLKSGLKGKTSVTTAIYDAGFNSSSRVYGRAGDRLGMTPRQYGRRAQGMQISYAASRTPLGWIMIGATDRGICFIQIADTKDGLLPLLQSEFPRAELSEMDKAGRAQFDAWMEALNGYVAGERRKIDLPLDIRGTAFQMKVWKYLQRIPRGETQSYAEVAKGLGQPGGARAIASACAANRIAIAIPCHRVIRGTGGLSGYKWGVQRKRILLDAEAGK